EEARAARDVRAREFGAVARGFILADAAEVADVVKQRDDETRDRALAPEAHGRFGLALVTHQHPRERESDVERVLAIVVDGVDAEIAGEFAGKHGFEMLESLRELAMRSVGP